MSVTTHKNTLRILVAFTVVTAIATTLVIHHIDASRFPPELRGFAVDPTPIGNVLLVDKTGQALMDNYFRGKWTLVFFGYTNCPDVCPSTLLQMKELYKSIKQLPDSKEYQFLFVTVDPERDTQTVIKSYVEYFDKDFDAAGGEIPQIKNFENVFGAFHQYEKKSADDTHYAVAHSAEIYIVDPRERYVGNFLPPFDVKKLTLKLTELSTFLQHGGNNA